MDTSQVIPQFTKAAAAGNVPDVQFLFNGIYHMENVWLGYLKPLNGLVSAATIKKRRRHDALELPGQVVPHGLLLARVRRPVQQGALRQGRPQRRLAAEDVGRLPGRLRQAQVEGLHPARRRHQGRLPRRVVARQLADAEPQQRGGRAQPVHRQARLALAEVPRALGQAAGAPRRRSTGTTTSLARASTRASSSTTPARRRWRSTTRRRCPTRRRSSARTTSAS